VSKKNEPAKKAARRSSNFANEVARTASRQKFIWDSLEDLCLKSPSTHEVLAAAENFGWPREKILDMRLSQVAVHLDPARQEALANVFQLCGLDPARPFHWRALLEALVDVGFKDAGAPVEWDDLNYYTLVSDIRDIRALHPHLKSHSEIARQLQKTKPFKQKYKDSNFDYFRKRISEARKMEPADTMEEFIAARRANQSDLPEGFVKAYIREASSWVAASEGLDPDQTAALIEEAEKPVGRKPPQL
jgi:hypothetical protein